MSWYNPGDWSIGGYSGKDIVGGLSSGIQGVPELIGTREYLKRKAKQDQAAAEDDAKNAKLVQDQADAAASLLSEAARKKRILEAGRRGRQGTILTGASGIEGELGYVNRPRAATLLGQTTGLGG